MGWRRQPVERDPDGTAPVEVGSATSAGPRPENQDRSHVESGLAVLSDGMGGYAGGAAAAELTVAAVLDRFGSPPAVPTESAAVDEAFSAANAAVRRGRATSPGREKMGATLTVAALLDASAERSRWLVASVGDSPGFVVDASATTLVTVDDTVPGQLLRVGAISESEALVHPYRHIVLHAIGVDDAVDADRAEVELVDGDAIVLVSDGISDVLVPAEIGAVVRSAPTAAGAALALVDRAVAGGTGDNATAVVMRHVASSRG